jgi:hypothetical protein
MREIWFPETVIAVFLTLFLARPFIKALWNLDGLVWLPLLALGIASGIFPAYGFRPECIPLLIYLFALNMRNFPALVSSAQSRPNDDFQDRGPFFTAFSFLFLGAVVFVMFAFSPRAPVDLTRQEVQIRKIRDGTRKRDYILRIYDSAAEDGIRPLIFLVPPESGSVPAVDLVCSGLRDRGFTVITYARRGFDASPIDENGRKLPVSLGKFRAYWNILRTGTVLTNSNEQGKVLEKERQDDIEFLLPRVPALLEYWQGLPLILVGYGAGGSALALLAENDGFMSQYDNIKGIVVIEGRLWSAWRSDPPDFSAPPANAGRFRRWQAHTARRFSSLKTQQVTGLGRLPRPGFPALYLISGRALFSPKSQGPYRAIFETMRGSPGPSALAALEGAGPLDYGDYPLTLPIYSFLLPGRKGVKKSKTPVDDTASLIANFSAMLLEREAALVQTEQRPGLPEEATASLDTTVSPDAAAGTVAEPAMAAPLEPPEPMFIMPEKRAIGGKLYLERRGLPEF